MKSAYDRYVRGEATDLNATSQAIITTFNKILDPTSVVRESEYARSPEGQSLIDAISGRIAALSQGGPGLTPASLKEFVDLANVFVTNAQQSLTAANAQAIATAQAFGSIHHSSLWRRCQPVGRQRFLRLVGQLLTNAITSSEKLRPQRRCSHPRDAHDRKRRQIRHERRER